MIRFRRRRKAEEVKPSEAPMSPMIDVVFQLLIFFLLTMNFKEVEGKLLSQLPKIGPHDGPPAILEELRIVLCAGGDTRTHRTNKGAHEKVRKPADPCAAMVEGHPIGELFSTEAAPGRVDSNRAIYRAIGAKLRDLIARVFSPDDRPPMIILDADSEVPYEHVIGTINACMEVSIHDIQFAANPRFEKYYK